MAPERTQTIDWRENAWFCQYWADRLTPAFQAWWLSQNESPDRYHDREDYWICCAFALRGWLARGGEE